MKKLILQAPYRLELASDDVPRPRPDEALLKVRRVGVCGSDIHAYRGKHPFVSYPRVLGHELGCEVAEVGPECEGFKAGDRVAVEPLIGCGGCYPCRQGRYNCCTNLRVLGIHTDGGAQEYFCAPSRLLHLAPPALSFDELAMIETMSIGAQGVNRSRVGADDFVFIIGAGPIGIGAMQIAKVRGATVAVGDVRADVLDRAIELGADHAFNFKTEDVAEKLRELTGGDGPTVVIEAVGKPQTIQLTVELVAHGGRVAIIGVGKEKVQFPQDIFVRKEIDFLGSRNSRSVFPELLGLAASGKVNMAAIISHRFSLEEGPEAFAWMHEHQTAVSKAILVVS